MHERVGKSPVQVSETVFETIREALLSIPGIVQAEVKYHEGPNGRKELVGFAVVKDPSLKPETVMKRLQEQLPVNQLPERIILVLRHLTQGSTDGSIAAA